MAVNVTIDQDIQIGQTEHLYFGSVTFTTYATGGVALDAANNASFKDLFAQIKGGYGFEFIAAGQLLKVYRQKDPGNAGGADIPLVEVANGFDLSAISPRFIGVGS